MEIKNDSVEDNKSNNVDKAKSPTIEKKPVKPPKLEDKPFNDFITNHFIP